MTALIELRNVTRKFNEDDTTGIHDIDLTIDHGEFVAIIGPSGAGKSTLLNILGLLDRPSAGNYLFAGKESTQLKERELNILRSESIGFVFQSSHVLGHLPVINNAAMGLRIQSKPIGEREEQATRALESLGIDHRADAEASTLSGGERQRLAIARAIATKPALILADEPTGSLDSASGIKVLEDLEELNRAGNTIIIVTHDPSVAAHARRQIKIVDGTVHQDTGRQCAELPSYRAQRSEAESSQKRWVNFLDTCGEAITEIVHRRLRTVLLTLAFALGVGGLVMSVGLSQTAAAQVTDRLSQAALDEVRVTLPGGSELLTSRREDTEKWIAQIRKLPHVINVGLMAQAPAASANIRRLSDNDPQPPENVQLMSADRDFLEISDIRIASPEKVDLLQNPELQDLAILGSEAARILDVSASGQDQTIRVGGKELAVLSTYSDSFQSSTLNKTVLVSASNLAEQEEVSVTLLVHTEQGYPAALAEAIPFAMDPASPGKFGIETVADLRQLRFGISTDLDAFVGIMSGILLALATISASTAMYLSVQARSSEIALRRAIGASRTSVGSMFILEGGFVGALGGAVGCFAGVVGIAVTSVAQNWEPTITPILIPLALALGFVTGLISAIVPAWVASKQDPITNL